MNIDKCMEIVRMGYDKGCVDCEHRLKCLVKPKEVKSKRVGKLMDKLISKAGRRMK